MNRYSCAVALLAMIAACGDSNGDGGTDRPLPDAGAPDSAVDAAIPPDAFELPFTFSYGGNVITQWTFDDAPIGTTGNVTLTVTNTASHATAALSAEVTGTDAAQFAIAAGSSCLGATLAPAAQCQLIVTFAPTGTAGARSAMITVSGGSAPFALALTGTATPMLTGLTADVSMLDFGLVELAHPSVQHVTLSNHGTAAIALATPTTSSIFAVSASTCPASLAPAATCVLDLQMTPSQLGAAAGNLTVPSNANQVTVHLTGTGARRLAVTVAGTGAGHVTSSPTDVHCSTGTCDALFPGDATFTATADTDNAFTGWSAPCTTAAACTVVATSTTTALTATFTPVAHTPRLHITFAGTGRGRIVVNDNVTYPYCDTDCTIDEPVGTQLYLEPSTGGVFAAWGGACAGTTADNDCSLTMTGDMTVTVTFNLEDRAVGMFQRPRDIYGLAFAADGSVLVGDVAGVAAVALDGTELWTVAITGGAHSLATDAAGYIYGVGGPTGAHTIFKLTPTGDVVWTINNPAVVAPQDMSLSSNPTVQVSADGSVVAAIGKSALYTYAADSTPRYQILGLTGVGGVTVAPSGEVAITSGDGADVDDVAVHRYDVTGAERSPLAQLYGRQISLASDASGNLGAQGTSFSKAKTFFVTAGVIQWSQAVNNDVSDAYNGMAFDSGGNTVGAFEINVTGDGMRIQQRSPLGGAVLWTLDRLGGLDLVFPIGVAADHSKRVAVARNDWYVTVYQMP